MLAAAVAVGLSFHLTTARRIHGADLTPALGFIEGQPLGPGSVAVGTHAYPVLRYLAESRTVPRARAVSDGVPPAIVARAAAADRPRDATHARVRNARRAGAVFTRDTASAGTRPGRGTCTSSSPTSRRRQSSRAR